MFSFTHSSIPAPPPIFLFPTIYNPLILLAKLKFHSHQSYFPYTPSIPLFLIAHLTCLAKPQTWVNLTLWGLCTCIHVVEWLPHFIVFTSRGHWMDFPSLFTFHSPGWLYLTVLLSKSLTPQSSSLFFLLSLLQVQPLLPAPDPQTSFSSTLTPSLGLLPWWSPLVSALNTNSLWFPNYISCPALLFWIPDLYIQLLSLSLFLISPLMSLIQGFSTLSRLMFGKG